MEDDAELLAEQRAYDWIRRVLRTRAGGGVVIQVHVVSGGSSRRKRIGMDGIDVDAAAATLERLLG